MVTCPDDGETKVEHEINLDEVEIQMPVDHTNKIQLTDNISLIMRYPKIEDAFTATDTESTEKIFNVLKNCISEIHDKDEIHNAIDISDKEMTEFFESMSQDQFLKLQEFFQTMPKLRYPIVIKNPKTKKKNEVILEGLGDFFA
jgi:hypothetical protein